MRLGPLARQPERATSGNVYLYLSRFSKLTNYENHETEARPLRFDPFGFQIIGYANGDR